MKETKVYLEKQWSGISQKAKDLIKQMLVLDPAKRISPGDAMKNEWIIEYESKQNSEIHNKLPLDNLKQFQVNSMMHKAVLTFIASQELEAEQLETLKRSFSSLDKNGDGQISKEELIEGYIKQHMSPDIAEKEVNEIFEFVDLNQNLKIDYNGKSYKE